MFLPRRHEIFVSVDGFVSSPIRTCTISLGRLNVTRRNATLGSAGAADEGKEDLFRSQRHHRQAFPVELVDNVEHAVFALFVRLILDEVVEPDIPAMLFPAWNTAGASLRKAMCDGPARSPQGDSNAADTQ